jgi:hypothetical protein
LRWSARAREPYSVAEPVQPPGGSREERIAANESWFKTLNERKAKAMQGNEPVAGFRCECWQLECSERILMSGREWQKVRSQTNRFAVAPKHVATSFEAVISEYPHFWLIEKFGEAGKAAEKLA